MSTPTRPDAGSSASLDHEADVVTVRIVDRVAIVTLDRPDRRNALDWAMFDGLRAAAARIAADDQVGAAVVTGAGGTFSSGLDTSLFGAAGPDGVDADFIAGLQDAFTAFEDLPVPSIAAIQGWCLGGGAQLAAACHLRLVADDARIAIAERRWGLVPDLGGTYRLPRLIGLGRANDWVMTGRTVEADEAIATGFAQGRMADLEEAVAYARDLATAPAATRRVPALLRENLDRSRDGALAAEARTQLQVMAGPDTAEAARAAVEGRPPEFVGR